MNNVLELKNNGEVVINVTHTDLDGVGCAIISNAKYRKVNVIYADYNNVNERVNEALDMIADFDIALDMVTFIISDISVDATTAERLNSLYMNGMALILADHHKTAEWLNVYPWATVKSEEHSGTSLLYELLEYPSFAKNDYRALVELIRDYDLWIHNHPASKDLNRLFYLIGRDAFLLRFTLDPEPYFSDSEALIIKADKDAEDKYYRRVDRVLRERMDKKGNTFGITYCDRYTSEIGHRLLNSYPHLDYVVLLDVLGDKVSLRSREGVDVSEVAKTFGGGGHKNASGFGFGFDYTADKIIERLTA